MVRSRSRSRWCFALFTLVLAACVPEEPTPGGVFDPYALLANPYLPALRLPGKARLVSSRTPEAADGDVNDDFNHFVEVTDERRVLMRESGPGVITRLWFTGREPATQDYSVMDEVVLHVEIDGEDVTWPGGRVGITLGALTGGDVPGFPAPWVGDRAATSNGLVVNLPMAYASSVEVWVEPLPGIETLFFYQVDYRSLPSGTTLSPFDGTLDAPALDSLRSATEHWFETPGIGADTRSHREVLPGGAAAVVPLLPGVVRGLEMDVASEDRDALVVTLVVDGFEVVEAPLSRFFFTSDPTEPYTSGMTANSPTSLRFSYPFPVRATGAVTVSNGGAEEVPLTVRVSSDPGAPAPELGALRMRCDRQTSAADLQTNFVMLDAEGPGHYAGQFLVTRAGIPGFWAGFWMLEGDHEVFADDVEVLGTGLEDYFGGSFYYLRGPFTLPLAGASGMSNEGERASVSQYRHHLLDTMSFDSTFSFTYENTVENTEFDFCAVWYRD